MPQITAKNIQAAKDALAQYHAAHAALSEERASGKDIPDFEARHTKLIEDFKTVLKANVFQSIDHFFEVVPIA